MRVWRAFSAPRRTDADLSLERWQQDIDAILNFLDRLEARKASAHLTPTSEKHTTALALREGA